MTSTLIRIFQSILRVDAVEEGDDFFDLGGDSASAVALILEIESELGVELPPTILFDAPTPAALAKVIAARHVSPSPVVLLKPGAAEATPLFLFPGASGLAMEILPLARKIETDAPVYGIQAPWLNGRQEPLASIEAMAECYLPAVRAIQPHGPYRLAGYSLGGLVALDIAQALMGAGEEIGLLAMLDTQFPGRRITAGQWPRIWRRRLLHHLSLAAAVPPPERLLYLCRRMSGPLADLRRQSRVRHETPPDPNLPDLVRRVSAAGRSAFQRYHPRRFDGTITFFRADEAAHLPAIPDIVWGDLAARFILHPTGGDHLSMLQGAHLDALAAQVSRFIRSAPPTPPEESYSQSYLSREPALCMS